jgi:hypothetical protein
VAKKRTIPGLTARTSGLVQMALGVRPKFTELPEDLHQQLIALYAGKTTPFLKLCGTSMAAKYLIVKVPYSGK